MKPAAFSLSSVSAILTVVLGLGFSLQATAQSGIYAYPSKGQTQQQQNNDEFECNQWSIGQTGYDPLRPPPPPANSYAYTPPPPPPPPRREESSSSSGGSFLGIGDGGMMQGTGMLGDAATGAALGAAGGAIAGDAGEGAAIGAIAGTLFGALSRAGSSSEPTRSREQDDYYERRRQYDEQQRYQQQQAQQQAQQTQPDGRDDYRRAYGACMTARGYTVQ